MRLGQQCVFLVSPKCPLMWNVCVIRAGFFCNFCLTGFWGGGVVGFARRGFGVCYPPASRPGRCVASHAAVVVAREMHELVSGWFWLLPPKTDLSSTTRRSKRQ